MLLKKFFQKIDDSAVGALVGRKLELLEKTDPERIYVENIRSFFNIPYKLAKLLCELAAREGSFIKKTGLVCPNEGCKRIIRSYANGATIPEKIVCKSCELEGNDHEFETSSLEKIVFYQLNREQ
jgi:hypothetical protein